MVAFLVNVMLNKNLTICYLVKYFYIWHYNPHNMKAKLIIQDGKPCAISNDTEEVFELTACELAQTELGSIFHLCLSGIMSNKKENELVEGFGIDGKFYALSNVE